MVSVNRGESGNENNTEEEGVARTEGNGGVVRAEGGGGVARTEGGDSSGEEQAALASAFSAEGSFDTIKRKKNKVDRKKDTLVDTYVDRLINK